MSGLKGAMFTTMSALLVACATATHGRQDSTRESGFLPPVQIEVVSDLPAPITVYLVKGGQRRRLGTLQPAGQGRFWLPGRLIFADEPLLIVAEPPRKSGGTTPTRHPHRARFQFPPGEPGIAGS